MSSSVYVTIGQQEFSPLAMIVQQYREAANRQFTGGKAQRDRMVHDSRVAGETQGVAFSLQVLTCTMRRDKFPKLEGIVVPAIADCDDFLDRAINLLIEAGGEQEAKDLAWKTIRDEFLDFVMDERMVSWEDQRREQAILDGTEQPTEEDKARIRERAEAARREAERLAALIS